MTGLSTRFKEDGFVFVEGAFTSSDLDAFEKVVLTRARAICERMAIDPADDSVYGFLREAEQNNPEIFAELCKAVGTAVAGLRMVQSAPVLSTLAEISGTDAETLFPTSPGLFWNDRDVRRLQYKWHQEASYLPGYKTGYHLWAPVFRDLNDSDGPMILCKGSHLEGLFPYQAEVAPQKLTQLEVADEIAQRFEPVSCRLKRGDAVIFHHQTIHCTGENLSDKPRLSLIIRYFDIIGEKAMDGPLTFHNRTSKEEVVNRSVNKGAV